MGRALVLVAVMGLMPEACAKILGQPTDRPVPVEPPPPIPSVTATAPPTYQPPEPPGPAPTSAPPPGSTPELQKARDAMDKKDYRKVKAILEKKVKGGKSTHDEAQLLMDACTILRDKACNDMVKKAHPEVE